MKTVPVLLLLTLVPQITSVAEIKRIWLTHKTNDPSKVVVNWMSDEPATAVVSFDAFAHNTDLASRRFSNS